MRKYVKAICTAIAVFGMFTGVATAGATKTVTWLGNGATNSSEGWSLNSVQCDVSNTPYLLFVLAGTKSSGANISINPTGGTSVTGTMKKTNVDSKGFATFQYLYRPGANIDLSKFITKVTATFNDTRAKNWSFNVSHGCLGATQSGTVPITLMGELDYNAGYFFTSLGNGSSNNVPSAVYGNATFPATSTTFCETGTLNCVTFAAGDAVGTVKDLTMTNPSGSTITVSGSGLCYVSWYSSSILATAYPASPLGTYLFASAPTSTVTTTTSYTNGDTGLFWLHDAGTCLE